jgi:hypothetical protein
LLRYSLKRDDKGGIMKVKWNLSAITVLILVFMFGAEVWCAGGGQAPSADRPKMQCRDQFDQMDTDKDKIVTNQEFLAFPHPHGPAEEIFKARDADKDDKLTLDELCAGRGLGRGRGRSQ